MIKKLLDNSEFNQDYVVVAATGNTFKRSQLDLALLSGKKTITLLSDMLIEGETVPEWDCAINMSDGTSMFKYLQFAFRPTNPDINNPSKEAYFYDMNPQRHFLIQNERMKLNGLKGKEKDDALRNWYKNFNIMIGGCVTDMVDVDFDNLKTESYNFNNLMRSIGYLMFWDGIDLEVMASDLNHVEKNNLSKESVMFNDNGLDGGKNNKNVKSSTETKNITDRDLEDIREKWSTIMSRVPYVLQSEGCETLSCLLDTYRDLKGMFEGAFGISQSTFEKYWNNSDFIDQYEMDFYFKNYSEKF